MAFGSSATFFVLLSDTSKETFFSSRCVGNRTLRNRIMVEDYRVLQGAVVQFCSAESSTKVIATVPAGFALRPGFLVLAALFRAMRVAV